MLSAFMALTGCSPAFDWRVVRHPEGLWQATFPDKPVVVSRTVQLLVGGRPQPVSLELRAARVGQQTFTIGVARSEDASLDKAAIRAALEEAMVHNIQGQISQRETRSLESFRESVKGELIRANGQMRLSPQTPTEPAELRMLSLVLGTVVIEAVVAGPSADFSEQAADEFLASFSLKDNS